MVAQVSAGVSSWFSCWGGVDLAVGGVGLVVGGGVAPTPQRRKKESIINANKK